MAMRRRRRRAVRAAPESGRASPWTLGGLTVGELTKRVAREVARDRITERAAGLAYYFLFSLFPALLFLMSLLGVLPIPNLMDRVMDYLAPVLPPATLALLKRTL